MPDAAENYRRCLFEQIKNAKDKKEAQQIALTLWHHMNATQEGFICRGCSNCAFVEDGPGDLRPPSTSP